MSLLGQLWVWRSPGGLWVGGHCGSKEKMSQRDQCQEGPALAVAEPQEIAPKTTHCLVSLTLSRAPGTFCDEES